MGDWIIRAVLAIGGLVVIVLGAAAFGGMFEFVDAHRSLRPVLMLPILAVLASGTAVLFSIGLALFVTAFGPAPSADESTTHQPDTGRE